VGVVLPDVFDFGDPFIPHVLAADVLAPRRLDIGLPAFRRGERESGNLLFQFLALAGRAFGHRSLQDNQLEFVTATAAPVIVDRHMPASDLSRNWFQER